MVRSSLLFMAILPATLLHAQVNGYCTPVVDAANSDGSGITYVHLNGTIEIDHTSAVGQGYSLVNDSASLQIGGYYTLTVEHTSGWSCPDNNLRAYIDFNGDGMFNESTETVALLNNGGDGLETFNFVVPGMAHTGLTRLRVCEKQVQSCGQSAINSCGLGDSIGYRGEIEDHAITIFGQLGVNELIDQPLRLTSVEGGLLVSLPAPASEGDRIDVYDTTGRMIITVPVPSSGPSVEVSLPSQTVGVVIVRASLANGQWVGRTIVR